MIPSWRKKEFIFDELFAPCAKGMSMIKAAAVSLLSS